MVRSVKGKSKSNTSKTLILAASVLAGTGGGSAEAALESYFQAGFNGCDATMLAAFWNKPFTEAKAEADRKIVQNGETGIRNVKVALRAARDAGSACTFFDTGLSFGDAETLAGFWGRSIDDAKTKVGMLFTAGRGAEVHAILRQ